MHAKRCICGRRRAIHLVYVRHAFTLVELLVTISIISLLMAMILPAVMRAKAKAAQTQCVNNLRQIGLALQLYADTFAGEYPPRYFPSNSWVVKLEPYYQARSLLLCQADRRPSQWTNWIAYRTYIINGFNDHFLLTLDRQEFNEFMRHRWPHGIKETAIHLPAATIVFGEQKTKITHYHMDFAQGRDGNDHEVVEHSRHNGAPNFAFVDGHITSLSRDRDHYPVNLWGVTDAFRNGRTNLVHGSH